ncbi:glycosyltransferase family 4 protein [Acidiphilium sp. PA]|uniref:glycosyltransferase family 4 protein n=1 Tax=Acidiphilium sp. PA TaxID=2871705 RepID=UPI0022442617|nr:glycosyltransferase family 4 protein [Acidiphilium sp. PA]MCW8305775.1 glycosyltransferase family 4 protein [Acidiphilium sp. PA]
MTAELARALLARGHQVAIYAPRLGALAETVMACGVPVTDRIDAIGFTPDLIHGHHNTALAVAMVRFPTSRAVFVCHDSAMAYDSPIIDARIGAYVGVDQACTARLLVEGAPAGQIHLVPNAVDLSRFCCRTTFAAVPRTALAVTKSRAPWLAAVRAACADAGISLTAVGPAVDHIVADLPDRMAASDIVFAWSRSAAEAAATGASVILCDEFGFGGLLSVADAQEYPDGKFARRVLPDPVTPAAVAAAIAACDPRNAEQVAAIVAQKLSLDDMIPRYETLYKTILASPLPDAPSGIAAFLERALPRFDLPPDLYRSGAALEARLIRLDAWLGGRARLERLMPAIIGFTAASRSLGLLGEGWAAAEDWGCWTIAPVATLDLPVALITEWRGQLKLQCHHYFPSAEPPDTVRSVEVRSGGRLLARWDFHRRDYGKPDRPTPTLALPISLWQGVNGAIRLSFHMLAPASPLAAGEGDDPRRLGLALTSIGGAAPGTSQN